MKSVKITISILFITLLSAGFLWAADYYVISGGTGTQTGNNWANALATIQKGIDLANASAGADTIHVAAGTYNEHIVLVSDVTLLGGYTATGAIPRDRTANPTIIDGTSTGRPVTIEDVSNVTIDGFWIQNGLVNGRGGGIYIRNASSVTINDNLITSNAATGDWGGGIAVAESSTNIMITKNDITGNNTDTSGGGMSFWNACTGEVGGNTISDNTAGGNGGGIIIADCSSGVDVKNNTIGSGDLGNTAEGSGGGITVDSNSTCEIDGNTIEANTATNDIGGGISVHYSEAIINNNSIKSNTCGDWGGGIAVIYDSNVKITNNDSIENNEADESGGGISFGINCTGEVSGNTISKNIAQNGNGGGIIIDDCSSGVKVNNNTIGGEQNIGNTAEGAGGGIMVVGNSPCVIDGNTIENNTATTFVGGGICIDNSEATISNNNIKSNTCADWGGGIALYQASTVLITGNAITQNSAPSMINGYGGGISFFDTSGGSVFKNTITNNTSTFGGDGIHIDTPNILPIIGGSLGNCNHIYNNGNFDLCYDGSATVNAEYNDWNTLDATVISTHICGTGTVDFTPWTDSTCSQEVNITDISIKPWVVPSDGTIDAWTTYDIWIDNQCGGWWQVGDPPMYDNEALIDGQPNRFYAQFRNTGTNSAFNIEATFYIEPNAAGGTNIDPNGDGDTSDMVGGFTPITALTQVVVHTAYPGVTDGDSDGKVDELAAGTEALVYVEWTPSAGSQHRCVAVVLKPENTDVNPGNNIGQENLHKFGTGCTSTSLPAPGRPFNYEAPIYNPHYPLGGYVEIQLDLENWPTDAGWTAELMGDNTIQFDERELLRNVTLTMSYPSEAEPGQRGVLSVSVWLPGENEPLGGFSVVLEIPEECECQPGDVSGDGTISAFDATLILQYVVGLINIFPYELLTSPTDAQPRSYAVSMPKLTATVGDRLHVPLAVDDATGLFAGGISLKYDSKVLKAVDVLPTSKLNGSYWRANFDKQGEVRFAFASVQPTLGGGNLFTIEFEVFENTDGRVSPLTLESVQLSESLNVTKINGSVTILPQNTSLLQNYPNPFNPDTWLPFKLARNAPVTINIYDAKGQIIRTISLGNKLAGVYTTKEHAAYWDGRSSYGEKVASGVYYYTLEAGEFRATRKMVILK